MVNYQIKLLHNIKSLIDKIDYYKNKNLTKEIYNEITDYFYNNIETKLSNDKINFDLSMLKNIFNININYELLKDKNLYFLYEYICYNLYSDINNFNNFIKLMYLGCFDLHLYNNVIYLNDFHINKDGSVDNIINYIGKLNMMKNIYEENDESGAKAPAKSSQGEDEPRAKAPVKSSLCENKPIDFYIYTDKEININNIEYIFNINNAVNIIHLHNHIYINDKLFLDYIDIPRYITFQYPNSKVYDDYFDNFNILKGSFDNQNVIFIIDNSFNIIPPYSVKYNFIIFDNINNNNEDKDENNIFISILSDIISLYKRYKDDNFYNTFPINEFNDINNNSKFYKNVINYFHPYLNKKYIDNIDDINSIKKIINNYITNFYNAIYTQLNNFI